MAAPVHMHDRFRPKTSSSSENEAEESARMHDHPESTMQLTQKLYDEVNSIRTENRVREEFQSRIEQLKQQYESELRQKKEEIERYSREIVELQGKIGQTQNAFFQEKQQLTAAKDDEINRLRDEIRELRTKLAIEETKAQFEGNVPFSRQLVDMIREFGPHLGQGLAQIYQQSQAMRQQQQYSHQPPQAKNASLGPEPANDASTNPEPSPESEHDTEMNSPAESRTEEQMIEEAKQRFADDCLQLAANALRDESHIQSLLEYIAQQLHQFHDAGITIGAEVWLKITVALAAMAQKNGITAPELAKVIKPIVDQLVTQKMYRNMLKTMPAGTAASMLFNAVGYQASENETQLVTDVLTEIKKTL